MPSRSSVVSMGANHKVGVMLCQPAAKARATSYRFSSVTFLLITSAGAVSCFRSKG